MGILDRIQALSCDISFYLSTHYVLIADEKSKYCKDYFTQGQLSTIPINDGAATQNPGDNGVMPRLEEYGSSGASATIFQRDGGGRDGMIRTNDSFSIISIYSPVLTVTLTLIIFSRVWPT